MARDKKSFIAYCDWIESFEELSDEEAGRLVKHLFRYVNGQNPESPDKLTKMCFIPIRNALKRDLSKYDQKREERRASGQLGNLKRWNKDLYDKVISEKITMEQAQSIAESRKSSHSDVLASLPIAKVAGSGSGSGSDIKEKKSDDKSSSPSLFPNEEVKTKTFEERFKIAVPWVINYLNDKAGSSFKVESKATKAKIRARMKEGYGSNDFKAVIDKKTKDWLTDTKMVANLNPNTLFGPKFEIYLNAPVAKGETGSATIQPVKMNTKEYSR